VALSRPPDQPVSPSTNGVNAGKHAVNNRGYNKLTADSSLPV